METTGMKISMTKTEVMCRSGMKQECNIYVGEEKLKQMDRFNYLGMIHTSNNLQQDEINSNLNIIHFLELDTHYWGTEMCLKRAN